MRAQAYFRTSVWIVAEADVTQLVHITLPKVTPVSMLWPRGGGGRKCWAVTSPLTLIVMARVGGKCPSFLAPQFSTWSPVVNTALLTSFSSLSDFPKTFLGRITPQINDACPMPRLRKAESALGGVKLRACHGEARLSGACERSYCHLIMLPGNSRINTSWQMHLINWVPVWCPLNWWLYTTSKIIPLRPWILWVSIQASALNFETKFVISHTHTRTHMCTQIIRFFAPPSSSCAMPSQVPGVCWWQRMLRVIILIGLCSDFLNQARDVNGFPSGL